MLRRVTNERQLAAVVAHGLINSLAVVSGAAHTVITYGDRLPPTDRDAMLCAIARGAEHFDAELRVILEDCSEPFGDAATAMALAGRAIHAVPADELPAVLEGIIDRGNVLRSGLEALVRGLPRDVVEVLDSLGRERPGSG
jgi:hypothetical protein